MSRKSSSLPPGYSIDASAPPMLRYQASLPRLPVPTLESTCAKYLETAQPLLTQEEFSKTKSAVSTFLSSPLAAELQKRLKDRAAAPETLSWLSEWWNEAAYMGYRDPVVVFVSYFFVHLDDRTRRDPAKRAASLIKAMLPFRELVESGRLEPEKVRGAPLCMASYKWLFHSSRYPVKPSDTAAKFDAKSNNHIIVLRKNRFFLVPLTNTSGAELSAAELEAQLNNIIARAGETPYAYPVGALTADNRDLWADARQALLAASPSGRNAELLRKIEGAMIVLALDDSKPITREDISWGTWVGDGRNRWYDKHQLVVYENGRSGFLGEHSCMDGTPTLRMNEFVLAALAQGKVDLGPEGVDGEKLPVVEELVFELDEKVKGLVQGAEKRFDELVGKHDLQVLHYEGFGKNFTKHHKTSPDATAQLIKQLAFHKMNGRPGVTYESAQTRKYQLGRTEVIRSASNESKAWAEAMLDPKITDPVYLKSLFTRAAARHIQYASWAADGAGVDRHLFGLKKLLQPTEPVPALYTDGAFSKSNHWELSTSQLSSPYFSGWGYGEVVEDGYGVAYAIGDDYVRWTITNLRGGYSRFGERVDGRVLKHYLAEAATEVKDMLEAAAKKEKEKEVEKAKL
ncbi:Carnitine O-acetyltransferase, mitochondrial [Psilocybe cubensis]|uniref:Carnitine O-acetyltransferase, mitochondrial n=2 Tax=Psilocybe cubensis TaxID=181762 RepID=A0A8H7XM68_PSICU|nr:Carnitine O-acetyltransferase, mitochondrial [Psilocybe cubensis]KAH9480202.1 Carnitine O-acetyltransferase, mitochondrial [Psilocybe cubensis]